MGEKYAYFAWPPDKEPIIILGSMAFSFGVCLVHPDLGLLVGMPAMLWGLYGLRWWSKPLIVFANFPLMFLLFCFVNGLREYLDDSATLHLGGDYHHYDDSFNLDPELRCFVTRTGDMRLSVSQDLADSFYNAGLRLGLRYFGPMDNHFLGPYPSEENVESLLRTAGKAVPIQDYWRGRVDLGFPDTVDFSFEGPKTSFERMRRQSFRKIGAQTILTVAFDGAQTIVIHDGEWAVLFDRETGRSYARYPISRDRIYEADQADAVC